MASDRDVIKEFLVRVGIDVKEQDFRNFFVNLEGMGVKLAAMAAAAAAAAAAVTKAVSTTADAFEQLYYQSQRTGTSAAHLKALGFAASQFGSSVEEAGEAVENLSKKFRDSPGYAAQLKALGVDMSGDNAGKLVSFMDRLAKMATPQRNAWLEAYGLSEKLFYAIENPQFRKAFDEYLKKQKQAGVNADGAAKGGVRFMQALRELSATISNIWDRAASDIFEKYGDVFKRLGDYLEAHSKEISDFFVKLAGWILDIAEAIGRALPKISDFIEKIGGWNVALTALATLFFVRLIPGLSHLTSLLVGLIGLRLPLWLLGLLGISGGAAAAVALGAAAIVGGGAAAYAAGGDEPDDGDTSIWGRIKRFGRRIGRGVGRWLGNEDGSGTAGKVSGDMGARGMRLMNRLVKVHGWTPESAAIAAGQAQQESSITPDSGRGGGDNGTAHGMFQWRLERHAALQAYKRAHPELDAFDAEVDFFNEERKQRGPLEAGWHSMRDLSRAGEVGWKYERYGDYASTPRRIANARAWLDRWGKSTNSQEAKGVQMPSFVGSANAAEVPRNPFGSLPSRDLFKTAPLGAPNVNNSWKSSDSRTFNTNQNVTIHVDGSANPTETAGAVAGTIKRSGTDLIRNLQPNVA